MLERQILFRDLGKLFHEFRFVFCLFYRFGFRILLNTDIVPFVKIGREQVWLFRHIHAEVIAGVQIIQVQVIGNVLFVGIVKISLEFPIREKSADRLKPCFPFKLLFGEQKMIDLLERPSGFISLPYGSYVIGIAIRESEFISVTDEPFAECFVFENCLEK